MTELKYYLTIFLRRLHYFLIMAVGVAAVSTIAAFTLPPAYESQTRLLLEDPQIPTELAASTVSIGLIEQLEIIEQRLMTRANLLQVARNQNVFEDANRMTADEIVDGMRARTVFQRSGPARSPSPVLGITFEARNPVIAAGVLNEYLTLIENQNAEFRSARAGNTLEFFEQEVRRLGQDLDAQSARILEFKTRNANALPDSLQIRLSQQENLQDQLRQIDREVLLLRSQRERLIEVFEATGQMPSGQPANLSPDERRLAEMKAQLDEALMLYSPENPRVKMLEARIVQLEERVSASSGQQQNSGSGQSVGSITLNLQLGDIDARIGILQEERTNIDRQLSELNDNLAMIPANSVTLDELNRVYENIVEQYNQAVDRLAQASTGERIENLSRGQRISIIEPPAIPTEPTKPNRMLIAGGGTAFGILLGLGVVFLFELLSRTARRPEDIIKKVGVRPLASIPYTYSRSEVVWKRLIRFSIYGLIIIGLPVAVYAVHLYYLPLDLLADRLMNSIGVRW